MLYASLPCPHCCISHFSSLQIYFSMLLNLDIASFLVLSLAISAPMASKFLAINIPLYYFFGIKSGILSTQKILITQQFFNFDEFEEQIYITTLTLSISHL